MTYEIDGQQYVAVAVGGNRGGVTTLDGDSVWSFSLNGTLDEVAAAPPVATKVEITGRVVKVGDVVATPGNLYDNVVYDGTVMVDVAPSNCVQCGAITAKGGRLTPPEGGSGPEYTLT